MRYRISEISLSADEYRDPEGRSDILRRKVAGKLRKGSKERGNAIIGLEEIRNLTIIRESIDARKKPDVRAVYTLAFESDKKLPLKEYIEDIYDPENELPRADGSTGRPVIAGFGPAGMFAALILSLAGASPLVIERGKPIKERIEDVERFWSCGVLDPESNVQYGEGGAGTFSDGKLTTGLKNRRIGWILDRFIEAGADPAIRYRAKPHIGTDRLRLIVPKIREKIESLGGEIRFSTKLTGIEKEEGRLKAVLTENDRIETDTLILATGHSPEDTFRMLLEEGVRMRPKPFSIGLRIEHPQEDINRAQYGDPELAELFGAAEYKLNHRCESGRGVYTFCMCPGGRVINASSEEGRLVTNGMSDMARDGSFANSGLLVDVRVDDFEGDDPLAGVAFQKKYEKKAWDAARELELPVTTYGRFKEEPLDPVRGCLPDFASATIIEAMPHLGRKLKGFDDSGARLTAVETRSSSPVKIERDDSMNSSIRGIIPTGEGPGYAGGIMSAALDGIRAAEAVLRKNHEKDRVGGKE